MPVGRERAWQADQRTPPRSGLAPTCPGHLAWSAVSLSGGRRDPSAGSVDNPEHTQPRQVDRGGQQREVGGDLHSTSHTCSSSTMTAPHQVSDLAFDLGTGGAVVGLPDRIGLSGTASDQVPFVGTDGDSAAVLGRGTPWRPVGRRRTEHRTRHVRCDAYCSRTGWARCCRPGRSRSGSRGRCRSGLWESDLSPSPEAAP